MTAAGRMFAAGLAWGAIAVSGACSSSSATPDTDAGTMQSPDGSPVPIVDAGGEAAVPPNGMALCPTGTCNFQTGEGCPSNMTCAPSNTDGKTPNCEAAGATA